MSELQDSYVSALRSAPWLAKQVAGRAWLIKSAHVEDAHKTVFLATDLCRAWVDVVSPRELARRIDGEDKDDNVRAETQILRRVDAIMQRGDTWDEVVVDKAEDQRWYDLVLSLSSDTVSLSLNMSKLNTNQTAEILRYHLLVPLIGVVGALSGLLATHIEDADAGGEAASPTLAEIQKAIDTAGSTAARRLEPLLVSNLAAPLTSTALERFTAPHARPPAKGQADAGGDLPEVRLQWPDAQEDEPCAQDGAEQREVSAEPETVAKRDTHPAKRQRRRSTTPALPSPPTPVPEARATRSGKHASLSPAPAPEVEAEADKDAPHHHTRRHDKKRIESPAPADGDDTAAALDVDGNADDLDAIVDSVKKRSASSLEAPPVDAEGTEDGGENDDDDEFESDMTVDEDDEHSVQAFAKRLAAREARRAQSQRQPRAPPFTHASPEPSAPPPKATRKRKAASPAVSEAPTSDTKRSGSAAPRSEADRAAALAALRQAARQDPAGAVDGGGGKRDKEEQAAMERKREEEMAARLAASATAATGRGRGRGRGRGQGKF